MTNRVTVRKATVDDAAALAGLRWRRVAQERGYDGADRDAFVASFGAWTSAHAATHVPFVASAAAEAVGMAWLMIADRVPQPGLEARRCGDVQSVYVVPEFRNGGVGALLLDALLAEAKRLDLEHVTVHSSERAVPFYQRKGFASDDCWLRLAKAVDV